MCFVFDRQMPVVPPVAGGLQPVAGGVPPVAEDVPPVARGLHHSVVICALDPREYPPREYPDDVVELQCRIPDTLNKGIQRDRGVSQEDLNALVRMTLREVKDDLEKRVALVQGYLCVIENGTSQPEFQPEFIILLEPSLRPPTHSYSPVHLKSFDEHIREISSAFSALNDVYM